jgi:hypothetical protein
MKLSLILLTPAIVAGSATTAPPTTPFVNPCPGDATATVTDCSGVVTSCAAWGDAYCDDGSYTASDFNCDKFGFDGGDCDTVTDCDGNTALQNLIGDGRCDNGQFYPYNFDCEEFAYDGGDCTPKNCHDQCVDAYPTDDGTCQEDFNCKKFEYSFQQCYTPECTDDWYDMGRDNYRCSQRTGGDRFASKKMTTFDECECYDFCQGKADEQGVTLNAFDNYSDKCRCWAGDCTDATTIACLDDGDRADEFSNTDGRCPSATYFPHDRELDCQDDADVTKYEGYFQANYHDDGFCDNKHFGDDREGGDDYSCVDGDDCAEATCDEIFEITGFAVLDEPNMVCDGHANEIVKEAEWTTACDCYTFCEPHIDSDMVMFQRDNNNMCQCLSGCDSQTNCGLESDCQIFTAERQTDCCGNDWTLGKLPSEINDGDYGEFWATHVDSAQGFALNQKVFTIDFMRSTSQAENLCIPEFMCEGYSYSFGTSEVIEYGIDDDSDGVLSSLEIMSSPCLECSMDTDADIAAETEFDQRCYQDSLSGNNAHRYAQLKDYYSYSGASHNPDDIDDYCPCEVFCRMAKFEEYAVGNCNATNGYEDYVEWLLDPTTQFAVDTYKGDCRCWDYCNSNTLAPCTVGAVNRCIEGPVQTTFPTLTATGFIPLSLRTA